jgi:hypothetical protein
MAWPALSELVKAIDISIYQNKSSATGPPTPEGRIDFWHLADSRPEIKVVFIRLAGNVGSFDVDFQSNYDESLAAGFENAVYGFAAPSRKVLTLIDVWKLGLNGRVPKLIVIDAEVSDGREKALVTRHVRDLLAAVRTAWPGVEVWIYTGEWWWTPNIIGGWEGNEKFWMAHYAHFVPMADGTWRVAYTFEELDGKLPIHNSFTPSLPKTVRIEQVEAWQTTSSGRIQFNSRLGLYMPRCDLDYVKLSAYQRIWGGDQEPGPQPQPAPIEIRVRVPAGKTTVLVEEI